MMHAAGTPQIHAKMRELTHAVNHLLLSISDDVEDYADEALHRRITDAAGRVRDILDSGADGGCRPEDL